MATKQKSITYFQEKAVLSLVNKHFWKSKIGPICSLTLPIFLMILYRISSAGEIYIFRSALPCFISLSILPLCFISLPQMIIEFKQSIILRKISTSTVTAFKFSFIVIIYNFLASICSTLVIYLFYIVFLNTNAPEAVKGINYGYLIYSLLNIYLLSISIGLMLGMLISKNTLVPVIGFCLVIISITFSGQLIPLYVLYRSNAIRYISLVSPVSYGLNQLNTVLVSTNQDTVIKLIKLSYPNYPDVENIPEELAANIKEVMQYKFNGLFDVKNDFMVFNYESITIDNKILLTKINPVKIYESWQSILNLIFPYLLSGIMIFVSIKRFKWTER